MKKQVREALGPLLERMRKREQAEAKLLRLVIETATEDGSNLYQAINSLTALAPKESREETFATLHRVVDDYKRRVEDDAWAAVSSPSPGRAEVLRDIDARKPRCGSATAARTKAGRSAR